MTGINRAKTWILIAALGGLFVGLGYTFGGPRLGAIMLVVAFVFNFAMYWFSAKIAIASSRSKPVTEREAPELYRIVRDLTSTRERAVPANCGPEMPRPNAFATGPIPSHSAL